MPSIPHLSLPALRPLGMGLLLVLLIFLGGIGLVLSTQHAAQRQLTHWTILQSQTRRTLLEVLP